MFEIFDIFKIFKTLKRKSKILFQEAKNIRFPPQDTHDKLLA